MPNAYKVRELTKREKAAIIYGIVTGCKDWNEIYLIARSPDPEHDATTKKTLREYASKWKHTAAVVQFYNEQAEIYRLKFDAAAAATAALPDAEGGGGGGNETDKPGKRGGKNPKIDFTETANALQELNRLANEIQDPKARADAIQAIQKLIAQTKTESDAGAEIHRFYTSLRCRDCVLYKRSKEIDEIGGI